MNKLAWIAFLLLLISGFTAIQAQTTRTTEAVTVNGLEFQVVGVTTWTIPDGKTRTSIPLALKVTNKSDNDFHLEHYGNVLVSMKDAAGNDIPCGGGADGLMAAQPPLLIAKGQSVSIDRTASLGPDPQHKGAWQLLGGNETRAWWEFDNLNPGKYTPLCYVNEKNNQTERGDPAAPIWTGKAVTKELAVEIVQPAAKDKP